MYIIICACVRLLFILLSVHMNFPTGVQCTNSAFVATLKITFICPPVKRPSRTILYSAARIGVVVIQETPDSDSTKNDVSDSSVTSSQSDEIQI